MKKKFNSEKEIYNFWEKEKLFLADPNSKKPKYSLLIPPPNLTGELHLGHAMQHSILDAIARFKRLQGFDVLLLPGVDHAGIQFESTFDQYLAKQNLSKQKLGREKWLELAWKFKDEIYNSVSKTWRFMGLSADWSREVFTLDEGPRHAVFEQFKTYFDRGLIYKGPYIVQWCPKCNTAIEDVEVEYEERKEKLYYIKYPLKDKRLTTNAKKFITVATTRPETIFADVAVAVYPNHPKYKKFVGSEIHNPLTGVAIPVIEDKRVEKAFGTGALKITPGHDFLDWQIGHDNQLEIKQVVDKRGKLTSLAQEFEGQKVFEAREKVVEKLATGGLIEKEEDYIHNVAVCERCKSTVEPIISEEWFVKVEGMAKDAIRVINAGKIKFLPPNYKKILVDWLANIHDWCISRSLWWGHRIPVWHKGEEIKVSMESPGEGWTQEEQVLDTWFSSGLWPLSTLGWGDKKVESGKLKVESLMLKRYFPWDFEISAPEIKYLWIARMIMISVYLTGKIPFRTMFFHGMLRDLLGRKFSKSLGNGIEPQYLIDKWGVDATRVALYTYSVPGRDGRVSKEILDERGKNFRNFATKIRNIGRFVIDFKQPTYVIASTSNKLSVNSAKQSEKKITSSSTTPRNDKSHKDDKWIRDELARLVVKITNNLERLELHLAVDEIYDFIWHKFADVYIEKSKARRADAQQVLEYVLKNSLILLHPFMPFLTEELYQKFEKREKSIMLERWPT